MTFTTELPLDFEFKYTPGTPPTRDYPGDGPEVEITKISVSGVVLPLSVLTNEMEDQMIEQVLEHYY